MRSFFLILALAVMAPAARADVAASKPAEDAQRPVAVAKALWNALGGDDGWNHARYLRFDWIVEREGKRVVMRAHYWDRFSGRYRVDGVDKEGPYSVYFDVNTRAGDAWVAGKKVTDAAQRKKWVDDGYEAFINDSYWLLAPFKVFDPGVTLADGGQDKGPNGEACDVLKLSFAGVGLTPRDVYWMLVDRKSHLMVEWKYVLGGESKAPTAFAWSDWKKVGPIELASMRTGIGKPSVIRFDNLKVSTDVDDAALTPPKQ
ncbi:MAG: hypothetical protein JWM53_2814 [bacterium]|nr:hypothetical protein [bacterium]